MDIDFQINNFTPFIPLSPGGEGQGEGKYQENVKLFIWKSAFGDFGHTAFIPK